MQQSRPEMPLRVRALPMSGCVQQNRWTGAYVLGSYDAACAD
jgi:hypothetical protein